jgi:hypothetical protein
MPPRVCLEGVNENIRVYNGPMTPRSHTGNSGVAGGIRGLSLNEAQDGVLHQLIGAGAGFGGYLPRRRVLLRRENVLPCFHGYEMSGSGATPVMHARESSH